jgi:SAM-dependent methyltransferase
MPDVYATLATADADLQERLAEVLEIRGADPQQLAIQRAFLADIPFPARATVLEVGSGTGVFCRTLACWPNAGTVIGVEPVPAFVRAARALAAGLPNVCFREADGERLPFENDSVDVVCFYTTLCHMPARERALAEAFRVLRPGGTLGIVDGDYAYITVGVGDDDPLQACANAVIANAVDDPWLVRRLRPLVRAAGFEPGRLRSHGYVDTTATGYMMTIVDRGADLLHTSGRIGAETAAALKAEARHRVEEERFFGHISYVSLVARKPAITESRDD